MMSCHQRPIHMENPLLIFWDRPIGGRPIKDARFKICTLRQAAGPILPLGRSLASQEGLSSGVPLVVEKGHH